MALRVCMLDLTDCCFEGVKIRHKDEISWKLVPKNFCSDCSGPRSSIAFCFSVLADDCIFILHGVLNPYIVFAIRHKQHFVTFKT